MRRMMQEWMAPKKDETVWDVVHDAMVALLGASIITKLIQLLFSSLSFTRLIPWPILLPGLDTVRYLGLPINCCLVSAAARPPRLALSHAF
jgi:hypothetical protein